MHMWSCERTHINMSIEGPFPTGSLGPPGNSPMIDVARLSAGAMLSEARVAHATFNSHQGQGKAAQGMNGPFCRQAHYPASGLVPPPLAPPPPGGRGGDRRGDRAEKATYYYHQKIIVRGVLGNAAIPSRCWRPRPHDTTTTKIK